MLISMSYKRNVYKNLILKELYFSKEMSCAELCERIDKSLPLVTKMLNELADEGVVIERGVAPSTGGRRPLCYTIKPDVFYVVAVAMDQLVTRIALLDMQNNVAGQIQIFDLPLENNPDALFDLANQIETFIESQGTLRGKIIGIGIGIPGFVDVKKGINHSFLKPPPGTNITDFISTKTGRPVFIDNDSSLIALAELRLGAAADQKNAMVINIGWGVGLGLILNGALYRGEEGFAGEFSHIPIFNNNKMCSCGKHGCLETETSLLVLIENARAGQKAGKVSSLQDISLDRPEEANDAIIKAALAGDRFAVGLLSEIAFKIGRGAAILIHLLNPKAIILSGRGSIAGKIWQAPIQQAINEYCIPSLARNAQVIVSNLGYKAEIIGAAALVMENIEYIAPVEQIQKDTLLNFTEA
jgi:predicted NBD/HSP70 family sugar kinase